MATTERVWGVRWISGMLALLGGGDDLHLVTLEAKQSMRCGRTGR